MKSPKNVRFSNLQTQYGGVEIVSGRFENCRFSRHIHDVYGLGVITSGTLNFSYRGETLTAGAGEVSSVNPDEAHDGHSDNYSGWAYNMLYFDESFFRNAFQDIQGNDEVPYISEGVFVNRDIALGILEFTELNLRRGYESVLSDSLLHSILSGLFYSHTDKRLTGKRHYSLGGRLEKVKEYINDNSSENITIKELADVAGMSSYHFIRSFRRDTGVTPYEYVTAVKAGLAKSLLLNGMKPAQAAAEAGYADQSHMTKRMKQIYGVSPSVFSNIVQ